MWGLVAEGRKLPVYQCNVINIYIHSATGAGIVP